MMASRARLVGWAISGSERVADCGPMVAVMESSPYVAGFWAVNRTAFTPYASAESRVDSLRNAKPGTIVERTRLNPPSSSSANTSPSGRAPPIQLAQSLGSLTMDCESCLALTMSVIENRPPGSRTRSSSRITVRLRKDRLMTALEITTSTLASDSGMSSIRPSWHAIRTPEAAACASALRHIVGFRSTPTTRPVGPTCHAAMMLSSSSAAAQVQYHFPGLEAAAQVRVAHTGEGRHSPGRRLALDHSLERGLLFGVKPCDVG